jgi:hypothetical protein
MKILSLLADFANGFFATLIAGHIANVDVTWHVLIGIAFAMLPDLDAIKELVSRGKVAASPEHPHDHREALHVPVVFIVVGIIFMQVSLFWGTMFLTGTMLHFINDMYGTGWGIPALWPLTRRRYKFFGRRANLLKHLLIERGDWDSLSNEERRLRFVVSWAPHELQMYIHKYGIEDWVEKIYLRGTSIAVIEFSLFIIAVGLYVWMIL